MPIRYPRRKDVNDMIEEYRKGEAELLKHIEEEREPFEAAWMAGFKHCLDIFSIWNDGEQTIGCLNTPIKECRPQMFVMDKSITEIRKKFFDEDDEE